MECRTYIRLFIPLAVAVAMTVRAPVGRADVQADYKEHWGEKEKHAVTPAERVKFANDLMEEVNHVTTAKRPVKKGKPDKNVSDANPIESLPAGPREEVLLLCNKAYEFGSKQKEGYAPAARALGVIQTLQPEKRLDSLLKLKTMYEEVYQIAPSKNLGISKGFANVCLQLGEEQWIKYKDGQANNAPRVDEAALIKAANLNFVKGIDVAHAAASAIRPYAKGKKEYEDFLQSAVDLEKDLQDAQKTIAGPLAAGEEVDRALKNKAVFQGRLAKNPADVAAADRLVRLYINELDDPDAVETILKQATAPVQDAINLMKKPPRELTAPQILAVVKWCDGANDNPGSPNRLAMNVRTCIYCDVYQKTAKVQDADYRAVGLILKRVAGDMVLAHIDADKIKGLTDSYITALEPQVAVVSPLPDPVPPTPQPAANDNPPTDDTPPVKTSPNTPPEVTVPVKPAPAPVVVAPSPAPAPPAPARRVASIKVEAPPEPVETNTRKHSEDSSIFDFGQ